MANRHSRLFQLLLWLVCFLAVAAHAESVKSIGDPVNYVTDLAGVLNQATQTDLNALCKSLDTQAHAQVFVVTVHKIDDDESIEQFANDLFQKWKVGTAKTDRGVLLVISQQDHRYRFEVGYGLEGILPDGKTGDIGRDMVPDLKDGDYDGAVRTAVNGLSDVIAKDAGVTLAQPTQHTYRRVGGGSGSGASRLFGILFLVVFLFFLFRGGGRGGRGGGGGFLSGLLLGSIFGGGRGYGGGGFDGGGSDGGGSFGGGEGGSSGGGGASGSW